ncbi:MAG TPA: hypothetical protein VF211_04625 [Burkholderiales bacterium]
MELSRAVASGALILGVLLVVGHARGDEKSAADPVVKETLQEKLEKREQARRAAVREQRRKAEMFQEHCHKPLRTPEELEVCRVIYRTM